MPGAEGEGAPQFRFPIRFALVGTGVDQVEAHPIEHALRRVERGQPLRHVMGAAEEMERLIVERLKAERGAVDPGAGQIRKARRLDRIGIGLQRDLYVRGEAPMALRRADQRFDQRGRHQRGGAAAKEDGGEWTAWCQRRLMRHVGQQRGLPCRNIHAVADMTVKIAVGTFGNAKGPMDI